MKNNSSKINEGCIKIFKILEILYSNKCTYNKIIDIISEGKSVHRKIQKNGFVNNAQVLLNKYLNTIKIFGIKIRKEKDIYKPEGSLCPIEFSDEELKSLIILQESIKNFPDDEIVWNLNNLIDSIYSQMTEENKITFKRYTCGYDFTFYYRDLKEQIEKVKQICQENFLVEITYIKFQKTYTCKCKVKDIKYTGQNVYLMVYDTFQRQNYDIALSNIVSIEKQPQVANPIEFTETVVYKLKGRLAKTYRLKTNEYSQGFDRKGHLIVINKGEPYEELLKRLMRYTQNCEIITPKTFREKMINTINATLDNYKSL